MDLTKDSGTELASSSISRKTKGILPIYQPYWPLHTFPGDKIILYHWIGRKTYEIKFFDRIRGAFTAAPTKEDPVNQIPQAAPTIDKPRPKATPKLAYP